MAVTPTTGGRAVQIDGLDEMVRTLKTLDDSVARSAMGSGIGAGMTVMTKAIRREVNATSTGTPHEASLKAGMRKAVGKRFKKGGLDKLGRFHRTLAVVGFGVGKERGDTKRYSRGTTASNDKRYGVTQATAHLFVLGTKRGLPPLFEGCVPRAVASSGEAAMQAAVTKAKQRFETLAARRAARNK